MLSNYFQKSKPIQNVFLIVLFSTIYTTYCLSSLFSNSSWKIILFTILNFFILIATAIIIKLMMNELSFSRGSNYFGIFFISLLCFFPSVMLDINISIAVFLSTFSMYRFLKIDFSTGSKLAVFDACLFLFTAAIFHFWVIIYSVLIIVATLRNYKNNNNIFLVPIIAFFTVFILFLFCALVMNLDWKKKVIQDSTVDFNFNYFINTVQRLSISLYFALLVIVFVLIIFQIRSKPLLIQSGIRKTIFWLILSILIFIVSPSKSNNLLYFSTIPLVILTSNFIEFSKDKILIEILFGIISLLSLIFFITQTFF
jgi:hypothetical protein